MVTTASGAPPGVLTDSTMGARASFLSSENAVIPDTLGTRRGGNLFHSFEKFGVGPGVTVTFSQSQSGSISSVFARVSGPEGSAIDGTLRSTIPGANFYLLNPNGVTFGAGGSVKIDGSFTVSTANRVAFSDGVKFAAKPPQEGDTLTAASLKSFGFLEKTPGAINFEGTQIGITDARGFTAIGGAMNVFNSGIAITDGPIAFVSVNRVCEVGLGAKATSTGKVACKPLLRGEEGGILLYNTTLDASGQAGGGVTLAAPKLTLLTSHITSDTKGGVSGLPLEIYTAGATTVTTSSTILTHTETSGKAGSVRIKAGSLSMAGSDVGSIATKTSKREAATGGVSIRAGTIVVGPHARIIGSSEGQGRVRGTSVVADRSLLVSGSDAIIGDAKLLNQPRNDDGSNPAPNTPNGGNVAIRAGSIVVRNLGRIASDTETAGKGGDLMVSAKAIHLDTDGSIEANTAGRGNGGNVFVKADKLTIGTPGNLQLAGIFANNDSNDPRTRGGNISVHVDKMNLGPGGLITTRATGPGAAGNIEITGGELNIRRGETNVFTGIAADSALANSGPAGDVSVNVNRIKVADGGQISSNTFGKGAAGNVSVAAEYLTVFGIGGTVGRRAQSTVGSESISKLIGGSGGDVFVHAGTLNIGPNGRISAASEGGGSAGDVRIEAMNVFVNGAGAVSATGIVSDSQSKILPGRGGNVWLDAENLTLINGARVSAATRGPGAGGDVTVTARDAFFSAGGSSNLTGLVAESLSPSAAGSSGNVRAKFGTLSLLNGGISATTRGPGAGGSVFIKAGAVKMNGASSIAAEAKGTGAAGSVAVTSRSTIALRGGSEITVKSAISDAGSIRLIAPDYITLQNSKILAEAGLNGGDVFIDPQFVILVHSSISANAKLGAGGNISLIADTFLSSESAITASSEASVQGTVDIQSPDAQLANALTALPGGLLGTDIKLIDRCPMRLGSELSSFLVIGRGGLPPAPEDLR